MRYTVGDLPGAHVGGQDAAEVLSQRDGSLSVPGADIPRQIMAGR
jgi:hypothetical protein